MHIGTLKKIALVLTFWLAIHLPTLKAQILGPYGTTPTTFGVDNNGLLSATGTLGTGTLSLSGAGTRMFWYPGKGAFRAGGVFDYGYQFSKQWDDANIGQYSAAFGLSTTASGNDSFATGSASIASGVNSVALGNGANATGGDSFCAGNGCWATGGSSVAMGSLTSASGYNASAFGSQTVASGLFTSAFGKFSIASGFCSTASGYYNITAGRCASAFGSGLTATAIGSFVVGSGNIGGGSSTTWVPTDPLFEIGNGTASSYYGPRVTLNPSATGPSDAFVVYKNGNVIAQGSITCAPAGDIPMYNGGS